jgi:hypothetical protein
MVSPGDCQQVDLDRRVRYNQWPNILEDGWTVQVVPC